MLLLQQPSPAPQPSLSGLLMTIIKSIAVGGRFPGSLHCLRTSTKRRGPLEPRVGRAEDGME